MVKVLGLNECGYIDSINVYYFISLLFMFKSILSLFKFSFYKFI